MAGVSKNIDETDSKLNRNRLYSFLRNHETTRDVLSFGLATAGLYAGSQLLMPQPAFGFADGVRSAISIAFAGGAAGTTLKVARTIVEKTRLNRVLGKSGEVVSEGFMFFAGAANQASQIITNNIPYNNVSQLLGPFHQQYLSNTASELQAVSVVFGVISVLSVTKAYDRLANKQKQSP